VKESEGLWRCPEEKADHNSSKQKLRVKLVRITRILEKAYGIPRKQRKPDPLDVLIQTILSQNTNDRNRDRAYQRLTNRFPRWENVIEAGLQDIIEAIRPGGLARQKARRIHGILRWIKGDHPDVREPERNRAENASLSAPLRLGEGSLSSRHPCAEGGQTPWFYSGEDGCWGGSRMDDPVGP
jgi:endonuclease III-like uncharacterized protein